MPPVLECLPERVLPTSKDLRIDPEVSDAPKKSQSERKNDLRNPRNSKTNKLKHPNRRSGSSKKTKRTSKRKSR